VPIGARTPRRFTIWGDVAQIPVLQRLSKNNEILTNRFSRSKPIIDALKSWLEAQLATVSGNSTIAEAIRYALTRWDGLTRFLDDGRVEIDSNACQIGDNA
jgi:hypothetical protein